jgi:acyl-CoA synthetase (AMP-forming)/AMP-acid ligase II
MIAPEKEIVDHSYRQIYRETYERAVGFYNFILSLGISKGSVIGVADYNTYKFSELLFASSLIYATLYPNKC